MAAHVRQRPEVGGLTGFPPIPGALSPRELAEADLPALQAFLDAHPAYYLAVTGAPAPPDEARRAFDEPPPAGTGWTRRWFLGLHDDAGALQGHAIVVADRFAPGTWHVALFLVATALHGSGVAAATLAGLEAWMAGQGARWGRLGVVVGHARAKCACGRAWTSAACRAT